MNCSRCERALSAVNCDKQINSDCFHRVIFHRFTSGDQVHHGCQSSVSLGILQMRVCGLLVFFNRVNHCYGIDSVALTPL